MLLRCLHLKIRESSALVALDMEMKHLENLIKTPDFHQLPEKQKNRSVAPMTLNQRLRAMLPRMNSNGEFGRGMILPNGDRVDSLVPEQCMPSGHVRHRQQYNSNLPNNILIVDCITALLILLFK